MPTPALARSTVQAVLLGEPLHAGANAVGRANELLAAIAFESNAVANSGLAAALANQQAQCNAAGQVVLKIKTPWLRWSHAHAGLHGVVREIPHANGCCEAIISAQ